MARTTQRLQRLQRVPIYRSGENKQLLDELKELLSAAKGPSGALRDGVERAVGLVLDLVDLRSQLTTQAALDTRPHLAGVRKCLRLARVDRMEHAISCLRGLVRAGQRKTAVLAAGRTGTPPAPLSPEAKRLNHRDQRRLKEKKWAEIAKAKGREGWERPRGELPDSELPWTTTEELEWEEYLDEVSDADDSLDRYDDLYASWEDDRSAEDERRFREEDSRVWRVGDCPCLGCLVEQGIICLDEVDMMYEPGVDAPPAHPLPLQAGEPVGA